jgi:hypothetical protein
VSVDICVRTELCVNAAAPQKNHDERVSLLLLRKIQTKKIVFLLLFTRSRLALAPRSASRRCTCAHIHTANSSQLSERRSLC